MSLYLDAIKEKYYCTLGLNNLRKGKFLKACNNFQKALLINPGPENLFNVGISLMSLNQFSDAEFYLIKVHEKIPENEINGLSLGECLLRQKKWKNAEEIFTELSQSNPRNKTILHYLDLSRDVIAREKYVKSKDLQDKGLIMFDAGQVNEALIAFQNAQNFDPENAKIYNSIGIVRLKQKNYKDAYMNFEKALTLAPANTKIRKNLMLAKQKFKK